MKISHTNLIDKLISYRKERDFDEKADITLELRIQTKELADEITGEIKRCIEDAPSEAVFARRLDAYDNSSTNRALVGKTLFNYAQELRALSDKEIKSQVFSILDRIFKLPIDDDLSKDDTYELLNSSAINPALTQLTQLILSESLIQDYVQAVLDFDGDDGIGEANLATDLLEQKKEVIANLGGVGLNSIQEKIKNLYREVYIQHDTESCYKLDALLELLRAYNPKTLKTISPNTENILLRIFMKELKKNNSAKVRIEEEEKDIYIFKTTAELLGQFNLKLSDSLISVYETCLDKFKGKSKLKALEAISKTKIDKLCSSTISIAEEMIRVLKSQILDRHILQGKDKLFASQFLINNPNLITGELLREMLEIFNSPYLSEDSELETKLCTLVVLNSWSKDPKLKQAIKESLNDLTEQILRTNDKSFETFFRMMEKEKSIDVLKKSIDDKRPITSARDLQSLINLLSDFVVDIDEYRLRSFINPGEAPRLAAKFSNETHLNQELSSGINTLFQFHAISRKIKSFSSADREGLENTLIDSLKKIGTAAEPELIKIVKESINSEDSIKRRQAVLAERVLKSRDYLPS